MDLDWQSIKTAVEHTLVPIAGAINMKRRTEDGGSTAPKPQTQILISVAVALLIGMVSGVSSGYISAQIALAVHKEKLDAHEKRLDRYEDKLDRFVRRQL